MRKVHRTVREPGSGPLIRLNWSKPVLVALAWLAFPAALMSVMTRFVTVAPQYFIDGMLGTEMLGYYAPMAVIPLYGQIAVQAVGSAALPRAQPDVRPGPAGLHEADREAGRGGAGGGGS